MSANEKILMHYNKTIVYSNSDLNTIGASLSTTLRTVTAHNDTNTKYIKKFGTDYIINTITNGVINTPRSDGGGVNKLWYEFYGKKSDDTFEKLATIKDENGISTFETNQTGINSHCGIARDTTNNLIYVTDYDNHRVVYFNSSYQYVGSFGSNGSGNGQFINPTGIAIDNINGYIYVGDSGNFRIQRFTLSRVYVDESTLGGSLANIGGLAICNSNQKLYIADDVCIRCDLDFSNVITKFLFMRLWGVAVDEDNNCVYFTGSGDTVYLDLDLTVATGIGILGQARAGVSVDNTNDRLYIVKTDTNEVEEWDLSHNYISTWAYPFTTPSGIFVDLTASEIYVSDIGDSTIKRFDMSYNFLADFTIYQSYESIKIKLVWVSGTFSITDGDTITLTTDVDTGGLTVKLSGETLTADSIDLYLSSTGSTYYDEDYIYGGKRHTPNGTVKYPYFDPQSALSACGGAFTIATVLDSETYEYDISISGEYTLQAALGQSAKLTGGLGARISREVTAQYNNSTACYFNKNGSDATGDGKWQNPYQTVSTAKTNRAGKTVVYGGSNCQSSALFAESITVSSPDTFFRIEADYSYICTIQGMLTLSGNSSSTLNVYGIKIDANSANNYCVSITSPAAGSNSLIVRDCTCYNALSSCIYSVTTSFTVQASIYNNLAYNCLAGNGIYCYWNDPYYHRCYVYNNMVYSCLTGIKTYTSHGAYTSASHGLSIYNNTVYDCTTCIDCYHNNAGSGQLSLNITYNTNFDCSTGLNFNGGSTSWYSFTVGKCIYNSCSVQGITSANAITVTYNNYYNNTSNYNVNVTSTNGILADTMFCNSEYTPYKLGLSSASPCLKADGTEIDIGPTFRNITVSSNNAVINGFILDGQNLYNIAVGRTGATDYTNLQVKWCSIYNYQGIPVDEYSGADTNSSVSNCKIYYNGDAVRFARGGNIIDESLIYNNLVFGVHANYGSNTINHCVLYSNNYGAYFESSSSNITVKNTIIDHNSSYGIYSEVLMSITYCCITDAVNENVDISDISNLNSSPLFVSTVLGSENFHIKTIAGGYSADSICLEAADDGYDIGAYIVDSSISEKSYKKYGLDFNPSKVSWDNLAKGDTTFESAVGSIDSFAKGHRKAFVLKFDSKHASTAKQRKKLEYISSLIKTRENQITDDQSLILLHQQPISYLETGLSGVIDSVLKTLTDTSKDWVENEHKGYWASLKFYTYSDGVIDATAKTLTKTGAGWTTNQHEGFYIYHNFDYYYIKSNTSDTLLLSDPNGTLVNSIIDFSIEKYFRIEANDEHILHLIDTKNELADMTLSYYIDFIEVRIQKPDFGFDQDPFAFTIEMLKSNYQIAFEES